jgi:hypothetical protein
MSKGGKMARPQKGRRKTGTGVSGDGAGKALRQKTAQLVPPAVRGHLRAAVREGLLALAGLCEAALKAVEGSARVTRQRIERIPVKRKR